MTDRINSFTVVLDRDIRDDDVEPILTALRMVKHVISVEPRVTSHEDHIAQERLRYEIRGKLVDSVFDVIDRATGRKAPDA